MKLQILRVCVLLVSISAASVLVWNATRDQKPAEGGSKDSFSPAEMQGSSKSKAIGQNLLGFEQEEVDANILAPSSKSGGLIEPEDISEIVEIDNSAIKVTDEEVKRTREAMLSTSKSGRVMSDDQIREMLEERKKEKKLMPSSKVSSAILRAKDLEEIIEGEKPDSNDLQEIPPKQE